MRSLINTRSWLAAGIAGMVIGGWLTLFAANRIAGIETGLLGSLLLSASSWLTLIQLLRPARSSGLAGFGEKQSWIGLGVTLLSAAYVITKLAAQGWSNDIHAPGMQRIPLGVIGLLIGAAVLERLLRHREPDAIVEDERDHLIRQRAARISHGALIGLIITASVTLGLSPVERLAFATPVMIAYGLIGLLALGELMRYASQIWLYRHERV